MRVVLDASVAVAAAHPSEPTHRASWARVLRVLNGIDEMVVPALFRVEVAAALARTGSPAAVIDRFLAPLLRPPTRLVTIGRRAVRQIERVAVALRLRAADASYVWVAMRDGAPLVTSDKEVLARAAAACSVTPP